MKKLIVLIVLLGFISCTVPMNKSSHGSVSNKTKNKDMELTLEWKPTEKKIEIDSAKLRALQNFRFHISPFEDCRKDTGSIGIYTSKHSTRVVRTDMSVCEWVQKNLITNLKQFGLSIEEDSAAYVIKGCVNKFFVTEGKRYRGESELKIEISTPTGKHVWAAVLSASSENWGISFASHNYQECLSNTLILIIESFLKNRQLVTNLQSVEG